MGGDLPDLLQYYNGGGGGVSRDPKFVLRNIWTAPKEKVPTHQKVFPHPIAGAPSASNSPSALSAQAPRAPALCARAGKGIYPYAHKP